MSHGHMIVGDVTQLLKKHDKFYRWNIIRFHYFTQGNMTLLSEVCRWMPILPNTDVDIENLKESVWNKQLWLEIETRQESWSIYALYKEKGWD